MAKRPLPSPEVLRQLLRYEPDTGKLFWLPRPREMFGCDRSFNIWNTKNAGKEAFTAIRSDGYAVGRVFGVSYRAHRVAWAVYFGTWPVSEVDHENLVPKDNRISNLRLATSTQNKQNQRLRSDNTSGHKGVTWLKRERKWIAHIGVDGKTHRLGYFDDLEGAVLARRTAAKLLHAKYYRDC